MMTYWWNARRRMVSQLGSQSRCIRPVVLTSIPWCLHILHCLQIIRFMTSIRAMNLYQKLLMSFTVLVFLSALFIWFQSTTSVFCLKLPCRLIGNNIWWSGQGVLCANVNIKCSWPGVQIFCHQNFNRAYVRYNPILLDNETWWDNFPIVYYFTMCLNRNGFLLLWIPNLKMWIWILRNFFRTYFKTPSRLLSGNLKNGRTRNDDEFGDHGDHTDDGRPHIPSACILNSRRKRKRD